MSQLALQQKAKYSIKVISGPHKGDEYQLLSTKISIGRSDENDIILVNDPKVSRKHVEIIITSDAISITNQSEGSRLRVNGKSIDNASLTNNSVITIGSTKIRFSAELIIANSAYPLAEYNSAGGNQPIYPDLATAKSGETKKSNLMFISIISIIVIAGAVIFSGGKKEFTPLDVQSADDIQESIQSADDLRVEEAKEFKSRGLNTKEFKEAQSNYIKGFRDYKKGQYERAISSFHACLSLYPKHLLCQRYQKLSYKKHEELIQYNMMLGKKYFDQGQYQACRSTFRNAMIMISDRSSKVYKEATANYKLCRLKTEGQY